MCSLMSLEVRALGVHLLTVGETALVYPPLLICTTGQGQQLGLHTQQIKNLKN